MACHWRRRQRWECDVLPAPTSSPSHASSETARKRWEAAAFRQVDGVGGGLSVLLGNSARIRWRCHGMLGLPSRLLACLLACLHSGTQESPTAAVGEREAAAMEPAPPMQPMLDLRGESLADEECGGGAPRMGAAPRAPGPHTRKESLHHSPTRAQSTTSTRAGSTRSPWLRG